MEIFGTVAFPDRLYFDNVKLGIPPTYFVTL